MSSGPHHDDSALMGGLLSSAFHAATGPDHLAVLLPFIFCKPWYVAGLFGMAWGAGHGLSSSLLGLLAVGLKGKLVAEVLVQWMSGLSSSLIGVTLFVIGALGLWEVHKEQESANRDDVIDSHNPPSSCSSPLRDVDELKRLAKDAESKKRPGGAFFVASLAAQFSTGFMLGFALDAIPSVSPALWLSTSAAHFCFFASYFGGTLVTMACIAAVVGECTTRLGAQVVSLPTRLAVLSSYGSIFCGIFWIFNSRIGTFTVGFNYLSLGLGLGQGRGLIIVLLALSPCVLGATVWAVFHELTASSTQTWQHDDDRDASLPLLYRTVGRWFPSLAAAYLKPKTKLKVGDTPLQKV